VKWSQPDRVEDRRCSIGIASVFATHAVFMWALAGSHYSGWPMSIVVGVIVALAVVRMTRERSCRLEENPVSRKISRVYVPALRWVLDNKKTFMIGPLVIFFVGMSMWLGIGVTLKPVEWIANLGADEAIACNLGELRWQVHSNPPWFDEPPTRRMLWRKQSDRCAGNARPGGLTVVSETRIVPGIGREFMPPLDEGSFLYMPSLLPQGGLGPAIEVNAKQDLAIATVPEVESVVGKLGRAETALDPAPIGMMESIIILKPEDEWRQLPVKRWFSGWPGWLKAPLAWIAPKHRQHHEKQEILTELQEKTAIPGVLPTWLQPIQTRLIMLQTGFRAMMGVKIYGSDLGEIERIGLQIESLLKEVPGATDIVADRIVGKPYLEFHIDRDRIARYGVNIRDVQDVIEMAIGGMNLMESVEGRERYPIRIRYLREFREDIPELGERSSSPSSTMRAGPARAGRHHQERARSAGDQRRARPACRLRHHEHARPR
jgi:Cu/Ag efflux pump CusA